MRRLPALGDDIFSLVRGSEISGLKSCVCVLLLTPLTRCLIRGGVSTFLLNARTHTHTHTRSIRAPLGGGIVLRAALRRFGNQTAAQPDCDVVHSGLMWGWICRCVTRVWRLFPLLHWVAIWKCEWHVSRLGLRCYYVTRSTSTNTRDSESLK